MKFRITRSYVRSGKETFEIKADTEDEALELFFEDEDNAVLVGNTPLDAEYFDEEVELVKPRGK